MGGTVDANRREALVKCRESTAYAGKVGQRAWQEELRKNVGWRCAGVYLDLLKSAGDGENVPPAGKARPLRNIHEGRNCYRRLDICAAGFGFGRASGRSLSDWFMGRTRNLLCAIAMGRRHTRSASQLFRLYCFRSSRRVSLAKGEARIRST